MGMQGNEQKPNDKKTTNNGVQNTTQTTIN